MLIGGVAVAERSSGVEFLDPVAAFAPPTPNTGSNASFSAISRTSPTTSSTNSPHPRRAGPPDRPRLDLDRQGRPPPPAGPEDHPVGNHPDRDRSPATLGRPPCLVCGPQPHPRTGHLASKPYKMAPGDLQCRPHQRLQRRQRGRQPDPETRHAGLIRLPQPRQPTTSRPRRHPPLQAAITQRHRRTGTDSD